MCVGEFSHPLEKHSRYYKSNVDPNNAYEKIKTFLAINLIKNAHFIY